MKRILFVDLRNTVRSQMAEAWFNQFAEGWGEARSCGTMPAERTDPFTVVAMAEAGIDVRRQVPKAVSQQLLNQADLVVMMGRDVYPLAFDPAEIWDFLDPTGQSIVHYRIQRDAIRMRVQEFILEIKRAEQAQEQTLSAVTALMEQQFLIEQMHLR